MASLRQIRRRMRSIENIHDITKAMEMIAGFRYKKAENRLLQSKPFLLEMEKLVGNLSAAAPELEHPLFEKREVRRRALVVLTGDKGLCGAYNTNLIRAAQSASAGEDAEISFVSVGKVGSEFFKRRNAPVLASYPEKGMADADLARTITNGLKGLFLEKKVDAIDLLYAEHHPGGTGKIRRERFLSLQHLFETEEGSKQKQETVDYIYEPDFRGVFIPLLERFLEGKIYLSLLESLTSEYSARMIAMKQATDNAEDVLDSLTLLRNKTRQATITRELSEIVSGANALA